MSKPALGLGPRLLPVHRGCPCSALVVGTRWVGGGQSRGGEGPEAHVCRLPGSLLSPQQRARVSQQELRYLWVWVSLSATESVQEVLLEGHPSWKYLKEVHTLLLDVQQSLRVSCAEVRGAACARACGGQGRLRGDERHGQCRAGGRRCPRLCLSGSGIPGKSVISLALFLEVPFGGERRKHE